MDNNVFDQNISDEINFTPMAEQFLLSAAKWSRFLSILGFVWVGLMFLIGVLFNVLFDMYMSMFMGSFPMDSEQMQTVQVVYAVMFIAMALLYFFPIFYLFRFSSKTIKAIHEQDPEGIEQGMKNLKSHYKYIGVLTILVIAIYAIAILFALAYS